MTDNPLVEVVKAALEAEYNYGEPCTTWEEQREVGGGYKFMSRAMFSLATAALRAIEDAGWKVVKKEEG